uniref:aspartate-semialdehyde dehydrogenase n=1 Tax=Paulinella longichromatophora TaxID=1708747 RepID=A0A2H4ZPH7_9EUKA|nr:aspartate-semialdehyde dehydrogenase [Paulinella longichromatophora]
MEELLALSSTFSSSRSCLLDPRPLRIAILGATGSVGEELLRLLRTRKFPISELTLIASSRSAGKTIWWNNQELMVQPLSKAVFNNIDLVFIAASSNISYDWTPIAVNSGALVIDNSSAFRSDPNVPLIVPEINPQAILNHQGILANPNCTTILLTLVLGPLQSRSQIHRVVLSTYQSASGAGTRAMEELHHLSRNFLDGNEMRSQILPYSLAFNLFLHNSPMQSNGYCEEEMKMINETRKIMGLASLAISANCIRVPILRAHSEAVNITFENSISLEEIRAILTTSTGIEIIEDFDGNRFPMPTDVNGRDSVAVGRLRKSLNHDNGLELWLCGDQIRKGAALNAIQIAELLLSRDFKR